jgi:putative transposase
MVLFHFQEDQEIAGKRDKPEEIGSKLRQVEVLQGQGMPVA